MGDHQQTPKGDEQNEREEAVEDLEVPEGQQDDVAGGSNKIGDIILK